MNAQNPKADRPLALPLSLAPEVSEVAPAPRRRAARPAFTAERPPPDGPRIWRPVYTIVERTGRSHWVRIGTAFVNRDQSLNVLLDAVPVNGQLHIREPSEGLPREPPPLTAPPPGPPC